MFVVLTSISFESPDNQNKFILVKQSEREGERVESMNYSEIYFSRVQLSLTLKNGARKSTSKLHHDLSKFTEH